jgi:uncharacterized membrane protein YhiD involved in acid resistance
MDYNDIIIILLLIVIIGMILLKDNKTYFSQKDFSNDNTYNRQIVSNLNNNSLENTNTNTMLSKLKNNYNNENDLNINNELKNITKNRKEHHKHNNHHYKHMQKDYILSKSKNNNKSILKKPTKAQKIIIDDYSEIKSLNSMDNTLSDIITIVENE